MSIIQAALRHLAEERAQEHAAAAAAIGRQAEQRAYFMSFMQNVIDPALADLTRELDALGRAARVVRFPARSALTFVVQPRCGATPDAPGVFTLYLQASEDHRMLEHAIGQRDGASLRFEAEDIHAHANWLNSLLKRFCVRALRAAQLPDDVLMQFMPAAAPAWAATGTPGCCTPG